MREVAIVLGIVFVVFAVLICVAATMRSSQISRLEEKNAADKLPKLRSE